MSLRSLCQDLSPPSSLKSWRLRQFDSHHPIAPRWRMSWFALVAAFPQYCNGKLGWTWRQVPHLPEQRTLAAHARRAGKWIGGCVTVESLSVVAKLRDQALRRAPCSAMTDTQARNTVLCCKQLPYLVVHPPCDQITYILFKPSRNPCTSSPSVLLYLIPLLLEYTTTLGLPELSQGSKIHSRSSHSA
jgi:hypothetical protein